LYKINYKNVHQSTAVTTRYMKPIKLNCHNPCYMLQTGTKNWKPRQELKCSKDVLCVTRRALRKITGQYPGDYIVCVQMKSRETHLGLLVEWNDSDTIHAALSRTVMEMIGCKVFGLDEAKTVSAVDLKHSSRPTPGYTLFRITKETRIEPVPLKYNLSEHQYTNTHCLILHGELEDLQNALGQQLLDCYLNRTNTTGFVLLSVQDASRAWNERYSGCKESHMHVYKKFEPKLYHCVTCNETTCQSDAKLHAGHELDGYWNCNELACDHCKWHTEPKSSKPKQRNRREKKSNGLKNSVGWYN